jgi:hypothetical protein
MNGHPSSDIFVGTVGADPASGSIAPEIKDSAPPNTEPS